MMQFLKMINKLLTVLTSLKVYALEIGKLWQHWHGLGQFDEQVRLCQRQVARQVRAIECCQSCRQALVHNGPQQL